MRIHSLVHRDDAKNESGFAMVILTGEEIISLNNLLYGATKSMTGKRTLLELAKEVKLLNAIVQHGGLDSFDIETLAEVDARSRGEKREGCMKGAETEERTDESAYRLLGIAGSMQGFPGKRTRSLLLRYSGAIRRAS